MVQKDEQESEILYELVKYSYHQIDNPYIKKAIFDTMNDFGEISAEITEKFAK